MTDQPQKPTGMPGMCPWCGETLARCRCKKQKPTDPTEGAKPTRGESVDARLLRSMLRPETLVPEVQDTPLPVLVGEMSQGVAGSPASPSGEAIALVRDVGRLLHARKDGEAERLVDSALSSLRGERDHEIRAVFGHAHSHHCPLIHEPTGAQIKCLACTRAALEHENQALRARAERIQREADLAFVRNGRLEEAERALDSAREALRDIEAWKLPLSGAFACGGRGGKHAPDCSDASTATGCHEYSFGFEYGSNGERKHFREIARKALASGVSPVSAAPDLEGLIRDRVRAWAEGVVVDAFTGARSLAESETWVAAIVRRASTFPCTHTAPKEVK